MMEFFAKIFKAYSRSASSGLLTVLGWQKAPILKICHINPTMMKLGTVVPYLKKIQKIYKPPDAPLEFC